MPYGDFAQREDVYGIITSTLTLYYGDDVRVVGKTQRTDLKNTMYCFPRIGVIIPAKSCRTIKEHVRREYRVTTSFWRRIVMDIYIAGVFTVPWLLCEKKMVMPSGSFTNEIYIEPGNKKIKIIDYKNRIISNLVKVGFKRDWIEKEIAFRESSDKYYVIPLLKKDYGYDEKIHKGFSFSRLRREEKQHLYPSVEGILEDFSGKIEYINSSIYISEVCKEIKKGIKGCFGVYDIDIVYKIEKLIKTICKTIDIETIPLCQSHGDLQEGNLFFDVDENKVYLIDLETYKRRSKYYDLLLLFYGFRNAGNIKENVRNLINDRGCKIEKEGFSEGELKNLLAVFFLEDLLWQINEMEIMPQGVLSNGLCQYITKNYNWILNYLEV